MLFSWLVGLALLASSLEPVDVALDPGHSRADVGASGGGLFDEEGALVGFLAFKARSGARLHFALPADWALPGSMVSSLLGPVDVTKDRVAFWQQPRASQPAFLGHAMLEAASQR